MSESKSFLIVDMGYACFYRFYATKTWYRFSHPDEMKENPKPEWINILDFVEKYSKMFLEGIDNIRKVCNVPWSNVILAQDCRRTKIWRVELYPEYKGTREASHIKSGFDGHDIFQYTCKTLIPKWIEKYGLKCLRYPKAEADDIVACLSKHLRKSFDANITILANDTDYLQLVNEKVRLLDMKGKERTSANKQHDLWKKILIGDTSDNIPGCYINQSNIYSDRKNVRFIRCTPKVINLMLSDWDIWYSRLIETPDIIRDRQHLLNQKLIDFENIPQDMYQGIVELLGE